jgi:predicted phosphodiesterase
VHGNLPALEAVAAEIDAEGFDLWVDLGDVMWGWPAERECLALLRDRADVMVRGNADREAGLDGEHFALVEDVLFVHATPADDETMITKVSPPERVASALEGSEGRLVVAGHVHHQFAFDGRWVNAGSVGLPYEGRPGAFWLALIDGSPDFRCTPYDHEAAIASLAPEHDLCAQSVRGEIPADEAAREFESRPQ